MEIRGDLATSSLYLSIPQAYMDYVSEDWDPPSRWDEGIPGLLFDYNLNAQTRHQIQAGTRGYSMSGNGTAGLTRGPAVAGRLAGAAKSPDRFGAAD